MQKKIKISSYTIKQTNILFGHQYTIYSGDADASAIVTVELGLVPLVHLLCYIQIKRKEKTSIPKIFQPGLGDTDKNTELFLG